MKHIPILFSTPMVQALLEGRKTQTRRVVKPQPVGTLCGICKYSTDNKDVGAFGFANGEKISDMRHSPYGQPGDVLWVRENYLKRPNNITQKMLKDGADTWPAFEYQADMGVLLLEQYKEWGWTMKPSIHMPKAACRLWLKVKAVRVERLQEISEEDAIAEGVTYHLKLEGFVTDAEGSNYHGSCPIKSYTKLWIGLNGTDSWNANPWVWVVEFERCEMPADFLQGSTSG